MLIPKPIKKWIAVFRGDVAPALILISAMCGFWFGLTPGWYGIHVLLLILALIMNVHFGIFLMFAAVGKAVSFAAAPLLYHAGVFVQDNMAPFLDAIASLPIIGITDVSRFAVAGALLAGPVIGMALGIVLARSVVMFRRAYLHLDANSEAFNRWRSKKWVGLLSRVFVGKGADPLAALKRRPKYIRMAGVVVAVLVLGGAVGGAAMIEGDMLVDMTEKQLTAANGAEVNVESLDLAILSGSVAVKGFAATDPATPANNIVSFGELTSEISLWELARGRIVMDEVKLTNVTFDNPRETPGKVLQPPSSAEDEAAAEAAKPDVSIASYADVESYFTKSKEARAKLEKLREWLPSSKKKTIQVTEDAVPETYLGYLDARARRSPTPRLLIRRLVLEDVALPVEEFGNSRIECHNLSDAPSGLSDPIVIDVRSNDKKAFVKLTMDYSKNGGGVKAEGLLGDIDLAEFQKNLSPDNPVQFRSGTATAKIDGRLSRETIDLGVGVNVNDMKADAAGGSLGGLDPEITSEAMKVLNNVETALRIVGPTDRPKLVMDSDAFGASMRDALVDAGKAELARRADELLAGRVPGGLAGLEESIKAPSAEGAAEALKGLVPGKSGQGGGEVADAGDTKKAAEDAQKQAKDALGGLFGGRNEDDNDE